jgi:thymidylate synthase (FAD)
MTEQLDRPQNAVTVHEPHGFIALQSWIGDDLDIVNAARVSYGKKSDFLIRTGDGQIFEGDEGKAWDHQDDLEDKMAEGDSIDRMKYILNDADTGLINYLMKNKHGTPFEMAWCKFHMSIPIFVIREWHRHRIASINEMSARYVQLEPRFYLPDNDHVRVQRGKPGHYTMETVGPFVMVNDDQLRLPQDDSEERLTYGFHTRKTLNHAYTQSYQVYEYLMNMGIAKEIARATLPVGIYTEQIWACNVRSLLNFLSLRNHSRALQELRDYAAVMEAELEKQMPAVHAAFVTNGRVAP